MDVTLERIVGVSVRDKVTPVVTKIMRIRVDGRDAGTVCVNPGSRINLHQWGWTPAELAEIEKQVAAKMGQECGPIGQPTPPPETQPSEESSIVDDLDA